MYPRPVLCTCRISPTKQSRICLDGQVEWSTVSEKNMFKWFDGIDFKRNRASHKRRTGTHSWSFMAKHPQLRRRFTLSNAQVLWWKAAQLVSKALHGPRELLPLHHLEALEDSSQKAVTCRQGNLQDYPEGWNQTILKVGTTKTY